MTGPALLSSRFSLLQVFNRYLHKGGEEISVDRIFANCQQLAKVNRCFFDSQEWNQSDAPRIFSQFRRIFYNADAARRFREAVNRHCPDVVILHNLYPVASPAIYRECLRLGLPAIQFIHNYRPFSPSGTLWNGNRVTPESLHSHYRAEILAGAWQRSQLKTLIFSMMLKRLHASGDLRAVKLWVAISDFIRNKFIEAGVSADRIVTLHCSWDARPIAPPSRDDGYYLFLSRLVEEKGVRPLLNAWNLLRMELGEATPPLLIAGHGPLQPLVQSAARRNPSVHFLDFVSGDVKQDLIWGCRAMLAPSLWWEPLGLVTYEAYDYAKPMLAAASGGLTETVFEGQSGFLHKPGDPNSLKDTVLRCEVIGAKKRRELGEAGRMWLLREADPVRWRERFKDIVESSLHVQ